MLFKPFKLTHAFIGCVIALALSLSLWQVVSPDTSPFRWYIHRMVDQFAHSYHLEGLSFRKASLGWGTLTLEEVSIADKTLKRDTLTIDEAILHFSPLSFYTHQFNLLELEGLHIHGYVHPDRSVRFGPLSTILHEYLGQDGSESLNSKIAYIDVNEGHLLLHTPQKTLDIPLDINITSAKSHLWTLDIDWSFPHWHTIEAHTRLNLLRNHIESTTEINHLVIDEEEYLLEGKKAVIKIDHSLLTHTSEMSASGVLQSGVIHRVGYLTAPLSFQLNAKGNIIDVDFDLECKNNRGARLLKINGKAKPLDTRAFAKIEMPRFNLSDVISFAPFLESQTYYFKSLMGQVQGEGQLAVDGQWLNPKGLVTFQFDQIDLVSEDLTIENGFMNLRIISLNPFALHQEQIATIGKMIAHGVPVDTISMRFSWPLNQPLEVRDISGKIMGGIFKIHSFKQIGESWEDGAEFALKIQNISLQNILHISEIPGLSGKGLLSGEGILRYTANGLNLMNARIKSSSSDGVINYTAPDPNASPSTHPSAEGTQLAFDVLKDLHFTLLDVKIKPPVPVPNEAQKNTGRIQAEVKIVGFNPKVLNAHPFEFAITTTGKLDQLVRNTLKNLLPSNNVENLKEYVDNK